MRVLVGSKNAWNDTNAVGNTLSNWFEGQSNMEFASLYSRSEMPANRVCSKYFRITETQMLKNILTSGKIGNSFELSPDKMNFEKSSVAGNERKAINFVKKHSLKPVYALSEMLWGSDIWVNDKLKSFISDFNPDIFFTFATEPVILRKRIQLIKELCNSKIALFVADDVYSVFLEKGKKRAIDDFKYCIESSDLLYGASQELCKEYSETFGKEFRALYKGCNIKDADKKGENGLIRLVYAGNLFYGRDAVLAQLAKAIAHINAGAQKKLFLEIYTASPVSPEMQPLLNIEGASGVMGARAYDEITEIMHEADIVLQVESFEPEQIKTVRLSFSTKISDCLQSGSAVIAIGPEDISSVKYMKTVDGAIVITDISQIENTLTEIAANPQILYEKAEAVNRFAKKNHDIIEVKKRINNDFENLLKG